MAEWIFEAGIGEARAALVADDVILEALIDWQDTPWAVGTVVEARMGDVDRASGRGFVVLPDGAAAILASLPSSLPSKGASCRVEIIREPMREKRRGKWPKARIAAADQPCAPGPGLLERIMASGVPVRHLTAHAPDSLEAAGWSEMIEAAASGEMAFADCSLHLSFTPAMVLIDVDGQMPRDELALAGARAAAIAIRRLGIGGSIGIDLPSVETKATRGAVGAAFDAELSQPYERTAVNGFGLMQVVRPRLRRSIPELIAGDPDGAAARHWLRRAERVAGHGTLTLIAAPAVIARLETEAAWRAELERRTGRKLLLRADAALGRWEGHVDAEHP